MESDFSNETILGHFIESIVDVLKEERDEEAFENYAHLLRLRIYEEIPDYKERFLKGYSSILEILQS